MSWTWTSNPDIPQTSVTIKDFKTRYFWRRPKDPFVLVNSGLDRSDSDTFAKGERIATFGYVNRDNNKRMQYVDLVTTSDNQKQF